VINQLGNLCVNPLLTTRDAGQGKVMDRLLLNGQGNITESGRFRGDQAAAPSRRIDCQAEVILMQLTSGLEEHGAHWEYAANGPDLSAD
jgi:hypothetical protein